MGKRTTGLARSIIHAFLQQLLSRLLPFVFHLSVKRAITPEDSAISTVHLQLLLAVVASLCKEGIRRGCLRCPSIQLCKRTSRALVPFTVAASAACTMIFALKVPRNALGHPQPGYTTGMQIFGLALTIDALIDPLYIEAVYQGDTGFEMKAEIVGKLTESLILWALFIKTGQLWVVCSPQSDSEAQGMSTPAITFALGYLGYSISQAMAYSYHSFANHGSPGTANSKTDVLETNSSSGESRTSATGGASYAALIASYSKLTVAHTPTVKVSAVFTWQACQKMMLQEATRLEHETHWPQLIAYHQGRAITIQAFKYLLAFVALIIEQFFFLVCAFGCHFDLNCFRAYRFALSMYSERTSGVYGEVQNLGSLVVRLIFWPIESAAFRAFSETDPVQGSQVSPASRHHHLPQLQLLLRIVILCAGLACAFGPSYSFSAIHILLSYNWSSTEAPTVLAAYCVYLLFLAVNGICEAYAHAAMTPVELVVSNWIMTMIVIIQASCVALLQRLGENCLTLVALDCCSMLARILVALWYMSKWHKSFHGSVTAWIPSRASILALVAGAVITNASNWVFTHNLNQELLSTQKLPIPMVQHIAIGIAAVLLVLLTWMTSERAIVHQARAIFKARSD